MRVSTILNDTHDYAMGHTTGTGEITQLEQVNIGGGLTDFRLTIHLGGGVALFAGAVTTVSLTRTELRQLLLTTDARIADSRFIPARPRP
jgi:hypothetical protein